MISYQIFYKWLAVLCYSCRSARFSDTETITNPIDRMVAHLLFHIPSESTTKPMTDELPRSPTLCSTGKASSEVFFLFFFFNHLFQSNISPKYKKKVYIIFLLLNHISSVIEHARKHIWRTIRECWRNGGGTFTVK